VVLAPCGAPIRAYPCLSAARNACFGKPQDVGRDENANAIALLLFRCGSSSDHGGHPVFRLVSRAEGPVRIGPLQVDAVSPWSWPYRARTAAMLRPLGAQYRRCAPLDGVSEADILRRPLDGRSVWKAGVERLSNQCLICTHSGRPADADGSSVADTLKADLGGRRKPLCQETDAELSLVCYPPRDPLHSGEDL
jgi:hypothetical protein